MVALIRGKRNRVKPLQEFLREAALASCDWGITRVPDPRGVVVDSAQVLACPVTAISRRLGKESLTIEQAIAAVIANDWCCYLRTMLVFARDCRLQLNNHCLFAPNTVHFTKYTRIKQIPYICGIGNKLHLAMMPVDEALTDDWLILLPRCEETEKLYSLAP